MTARQKKKTNKGNILMRYTFLSLIFLVTAVLVTAKLVQTTVFEAAAWNERARKELSKVTTIAPERGNILAANGNILACNLKVYDIMLDLRHSKIKKLRQIPWESVDSLADSLDIYFPRRSNLNVHPDTFAHTWHKKLREELEKEPGRRRTNLRIAAKRSSDDFDKVRNFPFLKDFKGSGFRIPVYKNARDIRIYPYGKMAYRSIGRVNENFRTGEFHGYSGLEKDLDSSS